MFAASFLLLLAPPPARAIQLRWSTGDTDLSVAQSTRALLLVRADSAEVTLPPQWRLQWTADSLGLQFAALDSATACLTDTARISRLDPPSSPEDSSANQLTAHFCSDGSPMAATAYYLVDIVGGSQGKLKVVALDPADSTQVIESNEVTYNGGIDGNYAPVLLSAISEHPSELLTITVIGSGLSPSDTVSVGSADDLWGVPLSISAASGTRIVASALVPAQLPAAVVKLRAARGGTCTTSLAADSFSEDMTTLAYTSLYRDPNTDVYPKDFAFYFNTVPGPDPQHPWQGVFHLFYIRHFKTDGSEPYISHAWSTDLSLWHTRDSVDFSPGTTWDSRNVWAPSIIKVGNLFGSSGFRVGAFSA